MLRLTEVTGGETGEVIPKESLTSPQMNRIFIIGNLGRDPELRHIPAGQAVTSFSVASNHRYKTGSGEQREETGFCCK